MKQQEEMVLDVKVDRDINLSTGTDRFDTKWKNKTMAWSAFLERLQRPTVTQESAAEYAKMAKSKRDEVKDVGGYVGGFLKQGRRKADHVQSRSIVTLDADSGHKDLWEDIRMLATFAVAVYTTHSHTSSYPRYRFIIPLLRPVTVDEYEPIARKLASKFGMDYFDDTTYQAERLMYWPSHSFDGEYLFDYQDDNWCSPDEILAEYPDWSDSSYWPESSRGHNLRARAAKKQGDPLEKPGAIGAFNRSYTIKEAIAEFLPEVYTESRHPDRYTFTEGSTSGGLVIYEDKFAYSHHGTDPVGDTLVNAFDLVRIHKFGDLDDEVKPTTPTSKRPSFREMHSFVIKLDTVNTLMAQEAFADFGVIEDEADEGTHAQVVHDDRAWIEITKQGAEINTYLLARQVVKEIPLFYDGYELLRYNAKKGIWSADSEEFLKSYIAVKKLAAETKIRLLSETIASIRAQTFSETSFADGDLNKIVLTNGVYDIKKDAFSPTFDPDLHARASHPIEFDAEADCPVFKGFVTEVLGEEMLPFIFEWFGYNFYRSYDVQKMLFIHGKGGTGKSTLINLLREMIGSDNYSAVTLQYLMTERFAKIGLYRKVANFDTDAKPQYLADGATLKMLTGEDAIYADRKNKEPITFYNYAKLTFAMNELPPMRDFSGGLKRRMMILTMDQVLTDEVKELYPLEEIQGELAGIFNGAMAGLRRLLKKGDFSETKTMKNDVGKWEQGNDVVSMFIEDECKVGKNLSTPVKVAYGDYKLYCSGSGYKPLSRNTFGQRMNELGFVNKLIKVDGKPTRSWEGLQSVGDAFL